MPIILSSEWKSRRDVIQEGTSILIYLSSSDILIFTPPKAKQVVSVEF
jgi:hypothetical protein